MELLKRQQQQHRCMEMEQQMADGEIHSPRPPKKYMDLGVLSASTLLYYAVVYVAISARA